MPGHPRAAVLATVLLIAACASGSGQAGAVKNDPSSGTPEAGGTAPSATKPTKLNAACTPATAADIKLIADALTRGRPTDGYTVKSKANQKLTFTAFYVDGAPATRGRPIGTWAMAGSEVYSATAYTHTLTPGLPYLGDVKSAKGWVGDKALALSFSCSVQSHGK